MKVRAVAGAMIALLIAASPALACKGEEELFADDFSDSDLSMDQWSAKDAVSIGKGYLQIKPQPRFVNWVRVPNGEKEFDICVDVVYPEAKNPDGGTYGGFIFWFKDWKNYYAVITTPVGVVAALSTTNERERLLGKKGTDTTGKILKTGAGAKNTFRLQNKANTVTLFGNDQRLFGFKTVAKDAADDMLPLALAAKSEEGQENAWRFSNVRLTK